MGATVQRREFITLIGGAATAWPLAARAQRAPKIPVIGVLWHAGSAEEEKEFSRPLKAGFADLGYVDGKTIILEERYPAEQKERFEALAAELVSLKVDVLVTMTILGALVLQRATSTIPIVFITNPDPVGLKLVSSLAHPGGNITGLSSMGYDLAVKRLGILKEAIPTLSRVALLVNPVTPYDASRQISEIQSTADQLHVSIEAFEARQPEDLELVFKRMKQGVFGATIITQNAMFYNERKRLVELALANGVPTLAPADVFIGAFMSYGPVWTAMFRNAGGYVDKILKGAKPADLPVQQPTEFRLVINLNTAKALGLDLAPTFLARADEVIE